MNEILLLIFIILQAVDGITTYAALNRPDRKEGNKALAWVIEKIGLVPMLILAKGFAVALGIVLYVFAGAYAAWALGALCLWYAWVAHNNVKLLKGSANTL